MSHERYRDADALRKAAEDGRLEEVTRLIAAGTNANTVSDLNGNTVLMRAVCNGHMEIVRVLLAAGADINRRNEYGNTALITAARRGHMETVRFLLAADADINLRNMQEDTAFMTAVIYGRVEIVRVLLAAGADINHRSEYGNTALILAVIEGHMEIVRVLLVAGAIINLQNEDGGTALMYVAQISQASILNVMIDAHLAQIRAAMRESISPVPSSIYRQPVTELPEDIYHCIQAFTPINALLSTSRRLVDVKRRLYYWNLTRQYSLLYYLSVEYRELFLSNGRLLHYSRKQVELDLRIISLNIPWIISEDAVNELRGDVLRVHLST